MPAWHGRLTEEDIRAVVAYILSISREQQEAGAAGKQHGDRQDLTGAVSKEVALGKALFFQSA